MCKTEDTVSEKQNKDSSAGQEPAVVSAAAATKEPATQEQDNIFEEINRLKEQISALQKGNKILRYEKERAAGRSEVLDHTAEDAAQTVQTLKELQDSMTDIICALVSVYEETVGQIDILIDKLSPLCQNAVSNKERSAVDNAGQSGTAAAAAAHGMVLLQSAGSKEDAANKSGSSKPLTKAVSEEKKLSIIEALKNNTQPAVQAKPAFSVTHRERANAKNLLTKYSKIK